MGLAARTNIVKSLHADILRLQGFKSVGNGELNIALEPLMDAFPNSSFPLGAVHEFIPAQPENLAATSGFIAGLLSSILGNRGVALWIGSSRTLFPPALKTFGIEPDRFIFIDLKKEKDVKWAMDEALKCSALSAVVAQVREIDFTASRRLQLAVEQSQVTGFIIQSSHKKLNTTACASRWKITSMPSELEDDIPGLGFPTWKVELLKVRNGKPGIWEIKWVDGKFERVYKFSSIDQELIKKAG